MLLLPWWACLAVVGLLVMAWCLANYVFGLSTSIAPADPVKAFTRSYCLTPKGLRALRIAFAMLFTVVLVYDMVSSWEGGFWWIYLTHWALFVETVFMVALAFVGYNMNKSLDAPFESRNLGSNGDTLSVKFGMLLNSITLPLCLLVTIIYWTALEPVWKICIFNGNEPDCKKFPPGTSVFVHFLNTVLIFAMFIDGEIPYRSKNAGWFIVFCGIYGIWTIIHYTFQIGTHNKCDLYPRDECPIYDIIDWHEPGMTLIVIAGLTLILAPLVSATAIGIGVMRDKYGELS